MAGCAPRNCAQFPACMGWESYPGRAPAHLPWGCRSAPAPQPGATGGEAAAAELRCRLRVRALRLCLLDLRCTTNHNTPWACPAKPAVLPAAVTRALGTSSQQAINLAARAGAGTGGASTTSHPQGRPASSHQDGEGRVEERGIQFAVQQGLPGRAGALGGCGQSHRKQARGSWGPRMRGTMCGTH